mmetsp:Transcript_11578/g.31033  ORF Transcript_11578/g.31033 Transcript_11578/m.31033 type:complete len:392 (-) Transcript_11578:796-1971(-)
MHSKGGLQGDTKDVGSLQVHQFVHLAKFGCQVLEGHVPRRPFRAHVHALLVDHFESAVVTIREDVAVGLTVHCFGAESGSNEIHLLPFEGSKLLREGSSELELDEGILLFFYALSTSSVMIGAWLTIERRVYRRTDTLLDLTQLLQPVELPSHKAIIIGVLVSGDECPSPVHLGSEELQIRHAVGREILEPVFGLSKLRDLFFRHANRLQNVPLVHLLASLSQHLRFLGVKLGGISLLLLLLLLRFYLVGYQLDTPLVINHHHLLFFLLLLLLQHFRMGSNILLPLLLLVHAEGPVTARVGLQVEKGEKIVHRIVAEVGGSLAKLEQVLQCILHQKARHHRHGSGERGSAHIASLQRFLIHAGGNDERGEAAKAGQLAGYHQLNVARHGVF